MATKAIRTDNSDLEILVATIQQKVHKNELLQDINVTTFKQILMDENKHTLTTDIARVPHPWS